MRFSIFSLCFLMSACSGVSMPDGVLPPAKMEKVLYDVVRADEMVDFLRLSDSAWQPFARRTSLYDSVFALHGIKKETFQKSLSYYQSRPDLLKDIIEGMHEKATDTTLGTKPPLSLEQKAPVE